MLDKTPYYGESGGQVGDTGELAGPGVRFDVIDTQKEGAFTLHLGHLRMGRLEQGTTVTARVDTQRRQGIRRARISFTLSSHPVVGDLKMKKIQVLGTGCPSCRKLADRVESAAAELGLEFELEKVTEIDRITAFDIASTPALVVDGEVKASGGVPSPREIKDLIS